MKLNADFEARVSAHPDRLEWQGSPTPGVSRRMLDRVGDEVARATTIVRYDAGSAFPAHVHGGGEEFVVLEGVFQDEHGDYPAGYYVRNPPQSQHTPRSAQGCTLFVKLWQFSPDDRSHVRIDTTRIDAVPVSGRLGVSVTPLFQDGRESVNIEDWAPGTDVSIETQGGAELLVLAGGFQESEETFSRHAWLRLPAGIAARARAGDEGARVWIKSGHLGSDAAFSANDRSR